MKTRQSTRALAHAMERFARGHLTYTSGTSPRTKAPLRSFDPWFVSYQHTPADMLAHDHYDGRSPGSRLLLHRLPRHLAQWLSDEETPLTVAGTAAASHRVPF
jgi:hypothetical protein